MLQSDLLAAEDTPALDRMPARVVELWKGRVTNVMIVPDRTALPA